MRVVALGTCLHRVTVKEGCADVHNGGAKKALLGSSKQLQQLTRQQSQCFNFASRTCGRDSPRGQK
eukprot:5655367-Amphidinium_carterae.1